MNFTMEFTAGELAALNRFADHWLRYNTERPSPRTLDEWRAIHKIREPNCDQQDLMDDKRP